MPYIEEARRRDINNGAQPDNAGELNFAITASLLAKRAQPPIERINSVFQECDRYLKHKGLRYQFINDVQGVLLCAAMEFKRRAPTADGSAEKILQAVAIRLYGEVAAPYEDVKRKENGDISYE